MEAWRQHSAHATPQVGVRGQQAGPGDERQRVVLNGALAVGLVVALEDAADVARIRDEPHLAAGQRKPNNGAVAIGALGQEGRRIAAHQRDVLSISGPCGPGGTRALG